MPAAVYILFGAAFTYAVSLALGKLLLRVLGASLRRQEEWTLGFVLGAACLNLLVFCTLALGVARKGVFLALGVAILGAAVWRGAHRQASESLPPLSTGAKKLFWTVFVAFTLFYFLAAMSPETSPDGSSYHLGLVARYLRQHGFGHITTNMYANVSQGVEMLFTFAFAFGKHSAAALVHFTFLVALAFLILNYGRRIGRPWTGVGAALLVYASPVAGIAGTSAYNDVAVAAIVFSVFCLLQIWDDERKAAWLVAVGVAAGFAYAAKYTAFLAIPYALGYILWRARRIRPAILAGLCALVFVAPWLVKNWIIVDNPFSPFLNRYFPNPYMHVGFEKQWAEMMRTYGLKDLHALPLEVAVRGEALNGLVGPVFLLAPLGLAALRWSQGRRLLLAGLIFLSTYPFNIGTRFLLPALPFLALAMTMALAEVPALVIVLVSVHALLSWPGAITFYSAPAAWRLERADPRAAFRIEPQDRWLREHSDAYPIARLIDSAVPPGKLVLGMEQLPDSYTSHDIVTTYQSGPGQTMMDFLNTALIKDFHPVRWLVFHFPPQPVRKLRALQTVQEEGPEYWSVSEFRIFSGATELTRLSGWRLTARPNPFEVQLAFDNSLATRWRSWQTASPGMYIEVDFARPEMADSVRLECSPSEWKTHVKLEGMDGAGQWKTLAAEPEEVRAPPLASLRLAAVYELHVRGIDYLLIGDSDYISGDVKDDPDYWGLKPVASAAHHTIYQVEPFVAGGK